MSGAWSFLSLLPTSTHKGPLASQQEQDAGVEGPAQAGAQPDAGLCALVLAFSPYFFLPPPPPFLSLSS